MSLRKFEIRINGMKHTVHEIPNGSGGDTQRGASWGVEYKIRTKNFDKFVDGLKLRAFALPSPAHPVDPTHEYGSAAATDEAQWDAARDKAAANAGGRRKRRKVKTVQRRRSTRLRLRQTRRRRPF
jgi:hypothetical protein